MGHQPKGVSLTIAPYEQVSYDEVEPLCVPYVRKVEGQSLEESFECCLAGLSQE